MVLDKFSHEADGLADLYRAAYYLALGSVKVGVTFLHQACTKISPSYKLGGGLERLADQPEESFSGAPRFWAEKVLDEYQRVKLCLSQES